ncbi:MAG: acetoin utilization protein AcuC, partial [Chloroflexota bacterium]
MGGRSAFVYSDEYLGYKLSEEHPLNPIRLALTESLIVSAGLLDSPDVFRAAPRTASDDEIMYAHDREYLERVRDLGHAPRAAFPAVDFGLGSVDNPVFAGMHEASALVTGGSLVAAEFVMSGKATHAFNPGGGLHHADRRRASGFCVYNDCAVVIAWLRMQGARVLYTDTDAHHGDGVQSIFYEDPGVLTISMHESGRYLFPGTGSTAERGTGAGFGYSVNVPLMPYTDHASFVECYDMVVPPLARAFKPDVIVAQNGCDGHAIDPLTHLHYLTPTFEHVARRSHELAHELC